MFTIIGDVVNASYEASDVLGSAGNSASGQRRRWSAFTEASLPLHGDWDVVLAGRRDDYDDVGATFSYQVASQYRLHKALAVRGSWSEGSRAPSLYALHKSESLSYPLVCDTKTFTGDLKTATNTRCSAPAAGTRNWSRMKPIASASAP